MTRFAKRRDGATRHSGQWESQCSRQVQHDCLQGKKSLFEVCGHNIKIRPLACWGSFPSFVCCSNVSAEQLGNWIAQCGGFAKCVQHGRSDGAAAGMAIKSIHEGVLTANDFAVYVWKEGRENIKKTEDCKWVTRTRLQVVVR